MNTVVDDHMLMAWKRQEELLEKAGKAITCARSGGGPGQVRLSLASATQEY